MNKKKLIKKKFLNEKRVITCASIVPILPMGVYEADCWTGGCYSGGCYTKSCKK